MHGKEAQGAVHIGPQGVHYETGLEGGGGRQKEYWSNLGRGRERYV
jgi:hypothetical protein